MNNQTKTRISKRCQAALDANLLTCVGVEALVELLRAGANPNACNEKGETRLHQACRFECLDGKSATELWAYGADPNARDHTGATPLHHVMEFHDERNRIWMGLELRMECRRGPTQNADYYWERGNLFHGGHWAADWLIRVGADVNAQDHLGRSAICFSMRPSLTEHLLELGADPLLEDANGLTPLAHQERLFHEMVPECGRSLTSGWHGVLQRSRAVLAAATSKALLERDVAAMRSELAAFEDATPQRLRNRRM